MLYTKILINNELRVALKEANPIFLKREINKMIEQLLIEVEFEEEHNNLRRLQSKIDPFERSFHVLYNQLEEFYKICDKLKVWVSYE